MLLLVNILNPKFIPCLKINLVTKSLFVAKGKKEKVYLLMNSLTLLYNNKISKPTSYPL